MDLTALLDFLRQHRLAVQASVNPEGGAQAALVGIAVGDRFEIVFDCLDSTRKIANLRRNPHIALVVGWDEEKTVQIDGIAEEPRGAELERIRRIYFKAWPDGRDRLAWPGITHVCVRPTWARYSDFSKDPPQVVEFHF
jgi:general stress protein 26